MASCILEGSRSLTLPPVTTSTAEDAIPLAFLVYAEESGRLGRVWRARSVLTGHIAEGRTADKAVDNLKRAIDAALYASGRMGLAPQDWLDAQRPDDPEHLESFARIVSRETCAREFVQLKAGRCSVTIASQSVGGTRSGKRRQP